MLTIKNRFIQLLKGKKAFMLIFAFIMATFTTGVLTLNLHYAKAETNVNSISITINEFMGTSGTVVQNDVGLTQRDFQVTRISASGGVGSYQVRLLNSDYIFANSGLTVTVNGAASEFTYDTDNPSRFIWFNYTASTNFIELYDGENLISSTINLGTVDKKDLATTTKTITILNPDPNPEQAGNPMAGPQTRTLGLSFSPKSSGSSGAGGSGSGGGDSGSGSGSGSSVMAFGTNPTSLSTITTGSSATFSIYLNTSLGAGTYTMTLRINSTQKDGFDGYPIDVTYDVIVTVTDTVGEQYSVAIYDGANKLTNGTVIDFGTVDKSELGTVASRTFTIKNEGTQGYSDFEISTYTNVFLINNDVFISTSLGVNGSYNVTLTVGTGTNAGEYQSYLNFGDKDHVVSGNLILRLKVTEQTPYLLEAYNGETLYNSNSMYNFGQAAVGSNVPAEHIFRIVNAGANATGDLSVSLQYTKMAADAFTVVNSIPSIAKNGEYNLSIQPKENLSAGEYQATVNIYNSNVSVSFKIGFTVFALTEVTSIVIPAGKLVAPAVDATINTQNGSGTGYNYSVRYQEYSGGDWVTPTSSKFMAGKTYRIIVTATKQQNSTFASNVTMMLGEDVGENITATAYQVIGYKTFAKLPAASYSLEVVGADQHYNSGTLTYTFDNLVDEYGVVTPGYLTLNNLGSNATGDFNVSFIIPNSGAEGYAYESTSYIPSIASGNSYIFEIKPAIGLAPSTYAENLTISNANISITLHIILTVDKKPYKMQVNYDHIELNFATGNTNKIEYILIGGDTATFGFDYLYNDLNSQSASFEREHENLKVGYSATDANRFETQIRIKNKGVNQLTNIEITRSGPGNEYFTISEIYKLVLTKIHVQIMG